MHFLDNKSPELLLYTWLKKHKKVLYLRLYPHLFFPCHSVSVAFHCPHQNKQDHDSQPLANSISLSVPQNLEDCPICALSLKEGVRAVGDSANGEENEEDAVKETSKEENHLEERGDGERKRKRTCFGHCKDLWNGMRRKLWGIVESKYFSRGIMIAILINTISMGIEHHNQVRSASIKRPPSSSPHSSSCSTSTFHIRS